jgi:steroid 5-alpha reductase family enzyme
MKTELTYRCNIFRLEIPDTGTNSNFVVHQEKCLVMTKADRRALFALPIILLIATLIAWAGSQGGCTVSGIPVFALCVAFAFILQWISFLPAYLLQTEKFYDLMGSVTYLSITFIAVLLIPIVDTRSWLLVGIISIWTIRLGLFLFRRVRAAGEDRRFRDIKPSFFRFLLTWTVQGMWVSLTIAAALAAITTTTRRDSGLISLLGILVWLIGFAIEVIADQQKSRFRADPKNAGKFINTGLWTWSRHPNYFGEIILWIGVTIIAIPVLGGWQWLTLISPIFVVVLLTRISGVPMLEKQAGEKWGGQADYEEYKARTSLLILRPPSSNI